MNEKIKLIIDHVGRFIVGEVLSEDADQITLKTPVIIHVQPNAQNGQLQVQTLPLLFSEFIADKDTNVWSFSRKSTAVSEVKLDSRLVQQYESIANPQLVVQQPQSAPEIIKLFDD